MTRRLALQQVIYWKRLVITSFWARFTYWHSYWHLLDYILSSLTGLSKTFQTGSLNFSRISLANNKCKSKILEVTKSYRVVQLLKENLNGRLKELNIILKKSEEIHITNLVEKYAKSMCINIEARFPQTEFSRVIWNFRYRVSTNVTITFALRVWKKWNQFFSRKIFPIKICRDYYERMGRI